MDANETVEWAVMDDDGQVTTFPDEQAADEYQAAYGGLVVARMTVVTAGWPPVQEVQQL